MLSSVRLRCVHCGKEGPYSVSYIEGQIKVMKQHKYLEVARQMKEKRGPFYDKWLAAMEKRGEQKRCTTCLSLFIMHDDRRYLTKTCFQMGHRGGEFACKHYYLKC